MLFVILVNFLCGVILALNHIYIWEKPAEWALVSIPVVILSGIVALALFPDK